MKCIVGLGNPGSKYADTRHNVGFMVLEKLSQRWGISFSSQIRHHSLLAEGVVKGQRVLLAMPQTYMNRSGLAVAELLRYHPLDVEQLAVVYDDLDLPIGAVRLRKQGSSGGHNGLKSIIQHIGTQSFPRVRIGIGRPPADKGVTDYVLSPFDREQQEAMAEAIEWAAEALEHWLSHPFEQTMNLYNRRASG